MTVRRVVYEAQGWGEGELWFDGPKLVWHELPRPVAKASAATRTGPKRARSERAHPHPGGGNTHHPLRSTIAAKRVRMGNEPVPSVQRLVHAVQRFFAGERVDFGDAELDLDGYTAFQVELVRVLRAVPYGEVVSYGELARAAGHANAQRAAGTFCAQNRFPLVVPCHRVVAANGIGAYGTLGIEYKRRLLELEGVSL